MFSPTYAGLPSLDSAKGFMISGSKVRGVQLLMAQTKLGTWFAGWTGKQRWQGPREGRFCEM